jgi:hypothetical protein
MTEKWDEYSVDEALRESFPASDPPCFVGAGAEPGGPPPKRKIRNDFGQYGTSPYTAIRP